MVPQPRPRARGRDSGGPWPTTNAASRGSVDQWIGRGDGGERYRPEQHLYADDLDVFGRGSLFELVGTARTRPGQDILAAWLLDPAPPADVLSRQAAVQELLPRLNLREALALDGEAASADRLSSLRAVGRRRPPAPRLGARGGAS